MASIAVVGGGLAGLVCAWRLRRAGHDVEVLEREPSPGGRLRALACDGFRLRAASAEHGVRDRNLRAVLRALEVAAAPLPGGGGAVLLGGRPHVPSRFEFLREPGLPRIARLRLAVALIRAGRRERAAALDAESAAATLARLAGHGAGASALAPLLQLACDAAPSELAWPAALGAWRAFGEPTAAFDADAFLAGLTARVRVRTACTVTSVETETGGARVRYRARGRERSVFADAVVAALSARGVADVCEKLTPEERGFFERVEARPSITAHLLLDRPPPACVWREIAVPAAEDLDLTRIRLGPHRPAEVPAGAGLVTATLGAAASLRCADVSDASLADLALESLAATPVGALAPRGFAVQRHACVSAPPAPGSLRRLARFEARLERSPRLAFAWEGRAGIGLEGAVSGGMRAANEVVRSLAQSPASSAPIRET